MRKDFGNLAIERRGVSFLDLILYHECVVSTFAMTNEFIISFEIVANHIMPPNLRIDL